MTDEEKSELLNLVFKTEAPEIVLVEPNVSAHVDQLFYLLPKPGGGTVVKQVSPRALTLLRLLLEES